jgi:plasmid stabilization system protein ParE
VNVRWSPLAIERVVEIAQWIAADRPNAADRLVDGLFSAVERLSEFPNSGRQVPEFDRPELREIVFQQFRIVYRVGSEHVDILTVRHSLQLMEEADLGE